MPVLDQVLLALLFFATSIVGVVTGSNSLITVPVMFQFGVDPKVAVATNMFGLTFMAIGGTIPFMRKGKIDVRELSPLVIVTIIGSALGAMLVAIASNDAIKIIVPIAMMSVLLFTIFRHGPSRADMEKAAVDANDPGTRSRSGSMTIAVIAGTFLLAIYGGLYSGGYVTLLTAMLIAFSGMSFVGSVAATKFINVFSSGIATLIFMWQGLVDYKLGLILAISMFAGAFVGAHYATKMNEVWLKRIFLTTVFILAIKMLFDFF